MNAKKIRIISIIAISSIFLLLYVGIWRGYNEYVWLNIVMSEQGVEDVRLIEQKLPFGIKPVLQGEEYTTFSIDWQENYTEDGYGLYLPSYVDLTDVYALVSYEGGGTEVAFDEVQLKENQSCYLGNVEEGAHILSAGAESHKIYIMRGSKLPTMFIDTDIGIDVIHEHRQYSSAADMQIFEPGGNLTYSGEIETLKGRGNSSWSTIKRSYGMKLATAAPLLGMTSGKSWTLIGGGYDVTGLRNKIFYDMAVECGLDNAIQCEWINLYIDGRYFGCYMLTEKIAVASGRLEIGDLEEKTNLANEQDVWTYQYHQFEENGKQWTGYSVPHQPADMSGGYLLEIEEYEQRFLLEISRFTTNQEHRIILKSPSHATLEQVQYISAFVQEFEDAIYSDDGYNAQGNYYLDYIDLESFVQRYLIDEISKNLDAGYSSYFFYKPWNESRLYAGPVWDYDTGLGNNRGWGNNDDLQNPEGMYANTANWSRQLWAKEDFQQETKKIFQRSFLPYLEELLAYKLDGYVETIRASAAMDQVYYGKEDWQEAVDKIRNFLQKRTAYLEEYFS